MATDSGTARPAGERQSCLEAGEPQHPGQAATITRGDKVVQNRTRSDADRPV